MSSGKIEKYIAEDNSEFYKLEPYLIRAVNRYNAHFKIQYIQENVYLIINTSK